MEQIEQITSKVASLLNGGAQTSSLETVQLPPGVPGKPYVISFTDGEILYIPLSKSATRLVVTGKETENAFAVVTSGGSQADPIGFHYHKETHDVFLCTKGEINVWGGEKCRTMSPGDFASVPPGTIHQYQVLGPHSDMIGLIAPGGWEEFFRVIGEPYSGPMWPMEDDRNLFEVLIPKLKFAAQNFDMVPLPHHKSFDPQPWEATDNVLPGKLEPYFLKNGTGPAYVAGGTVCRPFITTAESKGDFSIGSIESSSQFHEHSIFAKDTTSLKFNDAHHAFQIVDGSVEFYIDGSLAPSKLGAGEIVYVPKGTAFRFKITSRIGKVYAFTNGGGLVELLIKLGKGHSTSVLPEKAEAHDAAALESLQKELGFTIC